MSNTFKGRLNQHENVPTPSINHWILIIHYSKFFLQGQYHRTFSSVQECVTARWPCVGGGLAVGTQWLSWSCDAWPRPGHRDGWWPWWWGHHVWWKGKEGEIKGGTGREGCPMVPCSVPTSIALFQVHWQSQEYPGTSSPPNTHLAVALSPSHF